MSCSAAEGDEQEPVVAVAGVEGRLAGKSVLYKGWELLLDVNLFLMDFLLPRRSEKLDLTVTFAQSLDGKLAGPNGAQIALSCPESMKMTHRLRTVHDAILVGANTALNDNPQLNSKCTIGTNSDMFDTPHSAITSAGRTEKSSACYPRHQPPPRPQLQADPELCFGDRIATLAPDPGFRRSRLASTEGWT